MDQFLAYRKAKIEPAFNSTTYIYGKSPYIYIYIYIYICVCWRGISLSTFWPFESY